MPTQTNAPLPEGLQVGGYRIVGKIASGGFSIVYLAHDADGTPVALKEYLPSTLVTRGAGQLIPTVLPENLGTYQNGLKCFFEEGRALARVLHPNVVRVLNFFRANETVYMVMAYERGRSLQQLIIRHRGHPGREVMSERFVRRVFAQVMNGLREVHANRMLHLDIKPANVYLRRDGSPMLLDFGASRQTLTQDAPKLFPMYTPGFAAPELYRRNQHLGPWTDIYGMGATMFACLVGSPPQPADQRVLDDKVEEALHEVVGLYSQQLIDIVCWCLKLNPLERPQSVFVLQKALRAAHVSVQAVPSKKASGISRWLDRLTSRRRRSVRQDTTLMWSTQKAPH
jgi:hypothetical protein